jgi:hypothetical protein
VFFYATLTPEDCFLHPTGNWEKPTPYAPTIASARLNFKCARPVGVSNDIASTFDTVIENIMALQNSAGLPANTTADGPLVRGVLDPEATLIRFRHCLFSKV